MPRKILLMYVHAYQSCLWNTAVSRYIEAMYGKNVVFSEYSLGKLIFPVKDEELTKQIPIVGFATDTDCQETQQLLQEEGIKQRDFIIKPIPDLSSEGGDHTICIKAKELFVSELTNDMNFRGKKKCVVKFFLPKASYATMIIRQMFLKEKN